ncbi:trehalase [Candidatus Saccharibacteria bacterium]|nr:trehalase [Candidatus Saccharibacteria bacterium]
MNSKNYHKASAKLKTAFVSTAGRLMLTQKSPDEILGEFFSDVQMQQVFGDGKTFIDLVPKKRLSALKKEYELVRLDPNFVLADFVKQHYYELSPEKAEIRLNNYPQGMNAREHVTWLWDHLVRTVHKSKGTLFALPYPYIVPGGRFEEQFYWDSYFVMLGLAADKKWDIIYGMLRNYIFMADKFGFIPTANRTYFTSRSQPPFFAMIIRLLSTKRNKTLLYTESLPTLLNEYGFWMKGKKLLDKSKSVAVHKRLVRMPDGEFLNRYFDNKTTPRPEMLRDDVKATKSDKHLTHGKVFLDLRAAAESGWDFSSRWFLKVNDISTIHTTDFVQIDLNCLMYISELTIANGYRALFQPLLAIKYRKQAEKRAEAIRKYMWSESEGWFVDYDIEKQNLSQSVTLAGVFALYASVATEKQANKIAERLERDFLKSGGLVTTLVENGQQWDSPNGWAPLQWVAIVGLKNYGFDELAEKVRIAWMKTIELVYEHEGKMIEKYNVVKPGKLGGGGEYAVQDGFGWTNGVYAALYDKLDEWL